MIAYAISAHTFRNVAQGMCSFQYDSTTDIDATVDEFT